MTDVLIVSLGSTAGLRAADEQLAAAIGRCGHSATIVRASKPRQLRTMALLDLAWARSCRRAALAGIRDCDPKAVIYSSTTAAALWPKPGAIRFDATSAGNRPGRHGVWQRSNERRRLGQASLLLPWSAEALDETQAPPQSPTVVLPVAVEIPAATPASTRDIAAVTYAVNAHKKGLDRVLQAWRQARKDEESLFVVGAVERPSMEGVVYCDLLDSAGYVELLQRSRLYLTAPRREDYGIAQLEALANGCLLVTNEAPGPYAALPIARRLDERLVGENLAAAIRIGLDKPREGYEARARDELAPFAKPAIDAVLGGEVLPRLLTS